MKKRLFFVVLVTLCLGLSPLTTNAQTSSEGIIKISGVYLTPDPLNLTKSHFFGVIQKPVDPGAIVELRAPGFITVDYLGEGDPPLVVNLVANNKVSPENLEWVKSAISGTLRAFIRVPVGFNHLYFQDYSGGFETNGYPFVEVKNDRGLETRKGLRFEQERLFAKPSVTNLGTKFKLVLNYQWAKFSLQNQTFEVWVKSKTCDFRYEIQNKNKSYSYYSAEELFFSDKTWDWPGKLEKKEEGFLYIRHSHTPAPAVKIAVQIPACK